MKRMIFALLAIAMLFGMAQAADQSETLTVSTAAVTLTSAIYTGQNYQRVVCTNDSANDARFWLDGRTPTSTTGHKLVSTYSLTLRGEEISKVKFIQDSAAGGSATVNCSYYKN